MWTKARAAKHQRALAVALKHKPAIERLREMAKYNPAFAQRMEEMAISRENLERLTKVATAIDPVGS